MSNQANNLWSLQQKLQLIDWSNFYTAYSAALDVPIQIMLLLSDEPDRHSEAMQASHQLWCGLCHQHAFVSSAALPALPFLIRGLDSCSDELKVEILDILYGFSICTSRDNPQDWVIQLHLALLAELPRFQTLTHPDNSLIAWWSRRICKALLIQDVITEEDLKNEIIQAVTSIGNKGESFNIAFYFDKNKTKDSQFGIVREILLHLPQWREDYMSKLIIYDNFESILEEIEIKLPIIKLFISISPYTICVAVFRRDEKGGFHFKELIR